MATQGLVSVVRDGKTLLKVVAGCDGYRAEALAELLKAESVEDAKTAYDLARRVGFGCAACLVVIDCAGELHAEEIEKLHELYRATFDDPNFNPRWIIGRADYVRVIER